MEMTRKPKPSVIVGIDPDVERSGVAVLLVQSKKLLFLGSLSFPELLDRLLSWGKQTIVDNGAAMLVAVEAGWLVQKSNFHEAQGRRAEKIAKNVGANHQVGKLIIEMCEYTGIPVRPVHPLRKVWSGAGGKISADEFRKLTGYDGRTNQDARDAALLAWTVAY